MGIVTTSNLVLRSSSEKLVLLHRLEGTVSSVTTFSPDREDLPSELDFPVLGHVQVDFGYGPMVADEEEVGGGKEALVEQVVQLSFCVEWMLAGEANHARVTGNPSIWASAIASFALALPLKGTNSRDVRVLWVYCGWGFVLWDRRNSEILGEAGDGDLGFVILEEKRDRVEGFRELDLGARAFAGAAG